jgi:hypothetical protein
MEGPSRAGILSVGVQRPAQARGARPPSLSWDSFLNLFLIYVHIFDLGYVMFFTRSLSLILYISIITLNYMKLPVCCQNDQILTILYGLCYYKPIFAMCFAHGYIHV